MGWSSYEGRDLGVGIFFFFLRKVEESNESASHAGDLDLIPGLGRSPGGGNGNPLQSVVLPGEPHGQRSLAGYSPWSHKESGSTE